MYSSVFLRIPLRHTKFIFQQAYRLPLPLKVIHRQIFSIPWGSEINSNNSSRLFSSDGDTILEPESFEDSIYEEGTHNFSFKKMLYSEDEPRIKALNDCKSPQELLDLCSTYMPDLQASDMVQTIILLWDFCRRTNLKNSNLNRYIKEHCSFKDLLAVLLKSVHMLNTNESSCCYLYLKRIGLESSHKLLQELMLENLEKIKKDKNVPLTALSRFSVAVNTDKDINSSIICRDMMPHLLKELQKCTSAEQMRLITICFMNIRQLVSIEILESYKAKINEMITLRTISPESIKCILKILTFLNQPVWSHRNSALTRRLMLFLLPIVDDLQETEIKIVFRIFQSQLEPADIVPKLLKVSEKLLQKNPTPEMLTCVVQFVEPKKREQLIHLFKKLMADKSMWDHPSASLHFFTILRSLKTSDTALCDDYWSRVLNEIDKNPDGKEHYIFSKHCHRYMYFNNNLGGTYRHIEFEKRLTQLCMNEITSGMAAYVPSKFANIAPFVIGYGHTFRGNMKLPNLIVTKIESMADQFTVIDCLNLSRGIQIALEMRFRYFIPMTLAPQLEIVEKSLDKCSHRHINDLSMMDANNLNSIVRALNNRKASRKSAISQQALNKYNAIKSNALNSRLLRNMSFNLNTSHFVAPQILEKMFAYIVKHQEYVTGDTAEKILSCTYNLGYSPQLQEGLYSSAKIVMRDFDYMTGLSIIQACLALCFYKTISEELINKVFCVDFIKRIEEEIEMCYSKATYPERVLNQVMQLNRAVCLDFPEANVPWFQQNYLEAQLSKYPYMQNKYNDDVKEALVSVLKNESLFRCNHVTPYGYRIDFVIHFDNRKVPVPTPIETTVLDKITKVAILLLKLDSMCENDLSTLRGNEALKMRHLEMLGYKVIHINEADWKHMKGLDVKANYLNCLLQITS